MQVIRFNGDGNVSVTVNGTIGGQASPVAGEGIQVIHFNGDGDTTVLAKGKIEAVEDGIQVIRFNGDGAVSVEAQGPVISTGEDGIQVIRFNGTGDTTVKAGRLSPAGRRRHPGDPLQRRRQCDGDAAIGTVNRG